MRSLGLAPGNVRTQRLECRVDTGRVLAGTLGQVGFSAAAAVDGRRQRADEFVGAQAQILGCGVDGDDIRDSLPRISPTNDRRSAAVVASPDSEGIRVNTTRTLPTSSAPAAAVDAADAAVDRRIRSISFSATFNRSTRVATREGTSSDGTFSDDARPASRARSLARCLKESSPT
jgi:hypothetical protein